MIYLLLLEFRSLLNTIQIKIFWQYNEFSNINKILMVISKNIKLIELQEVLNSVKA